MVLNRCSAFIADKRRQIKVSFDGDKVYEFRDIIAKVINDQNGVFDIEKYIKEVLERDNVL